MTQLPAAIAEAIAELELYDDTEHRAVLEIVRALLNDLLEPPEIAPNQ
jgi:hypothetical protein